MPNKINIGLSNTLVVKDREMVHNMSHRMSKNALLYVSAMICMNKVKDTDFSRYSTTAKELSDILKVKVDTPLLDRLGKELSTYSAIYYEGNKKRFVPFFKYLEYDIDTRELISEFNEEMKPFLLNLRKNFLEYNYKNILLLKSDYVIKLYDICKDKLENRKIKVNIVNFELELDYIKKIMDIPKSYQYSSHIKKLILDKSVKQFADYTDINMSYREKRKGNKVASLMFSVKRLKQKESTKSKFSPTLKFREILLKAIELIIEPHESWDIDFYEIGDGYCLIRAGKDKLLLCDENGTMIDDYEDAWVYIFENKEKLLGEDWVRDNKKEWEGL